MKRWAILRRPLRGGIITWTFVPTVAVLVAVAVIAFLAYERAAQDEAIAQDRERAVLASNRLREEMAKLSNELLALARREAAEGIEPLRQSVELRRARLRMAVFDGGVVLLDHFGRVVAAEPPRPEVVGADWSNRSFFRQLLAGKDLVFSDASADGPAGAAVVVTAVPIIGADGEFQGAVAGMFRLGEPTISAFYASIVRLRAAEGASLYLVDGRGRVIFAPQVEQIGTSRAGEQAVIEVLGGHVGAWREPSGERDTVFAFAPVPGTSWGLLMERDWATVVGPSRQYSRFLLLLLALGIVLPAAGFALLARERRAEALQRARTEQEMRVARLIQHTLLPRDTPNLPGWQVSGHYQPAQAVGGDFYDYLRLDDGALGLVVGDVSGKGVPAALVMATTRSLVRSIGARVRSPGQVLSQVNDMLDRDIPSKMFVTCLYAVLDPVTGRLVYANAGHNLPYRTNPESGVDELRARGMPLGLMPGMVYEEVETSIEPGDCVLFYSDGLVEAHNTRREMFGGPRLRAILHGCANSCPTLITFVLEQLQAFTGTNWEQEDDVTLVTLQRSAVREALFPPSTSFVQDRALPELVPAAGPRASGPTQVVADAAVPCDGQPAGAPQADGHTPAPCDDPLHGTGWRLVARFSLPSAPGNEREVMRRVAQLVEPLIAAPEQLDRLKTAVAEATMNAMEHGNRYQPELPVEVCVLASDEAIAVRISDHGGGPDLERPPAPDLWAKLAGQQSPRGWGLFLMNHMVDDVHHLEDDVHHTVELILWLKGGMDGSQGA